MSTVLQVENNLIYWAVNQAEVSAGQTEASQVTTMFCFFHLKKIVIESLSVFKVTFEISVSTVNKSMKITVYNSL